MKLIKIAYISMRLMRAKQKAAIMAKDNCNACELIESSVIK